MPGDNGDQARQLGQTAQLRFRPVITGPEAATPATQQHAPRPTDGAAPTDPAAASATPSAAPPASAGPDAGAAAPSARAASGGAAPDPPADPHAPAGDPGGGDGGLRDAHLRHARRPARSTGPRTTSPRAARTAGQVPARPRDGRGHRRHRRQPPAPDPTTGEWIVQLDFNNAGLGEVGRVHRRQRSASRSASPSTAASSRRRRSTARSTAAPQITGSFNQQTATELANQLKYGALPLTLHRRRRRSRSPPSWAPSSCEAGLIAGAIGIALVFLYALLYYRCSAWS